MTFIRSKEIPPHSGNWYDYAVMTVHEGDKVRQKVIQYLGKSAARRSPRKKSKPVVDAFLTPVSETKGESA
ncbi:MAG: hypothetical protein Q7R34_07910 [Dehalococcoidia bacterium]|nr:hypothetical protein [Dehalococcoidia bacterium]